MPVWAGLAAFGLIAVSAGLAGPTLDAFLPQALMAIAWATLLASLVRETLVPDGGVQRIVPATDAVAWKVAVLLWALIAVWLLDKLFVLKDFIVFTPYQVSVFRSTLFAALCGLLLLSVLWTIHKGPQIRQAALSGWRGWLFSLAAVLTGAILLAMLLGYESLAHFIGTHAVSTAGVLWIMYLLHLAAESISSVSMISGQAIDDDIEEDENMGAPSLLTMRIIASLFLDIAILAVGITILLLLWRFDWVEVHSWIKAAFFGFQFGPIRISLQSVLIALGVFALGLALTRFVQRWVTGRVFAGRKSESGLHESVRIGIGYLGFVLAALAGISYLGVDFSNLAIIAGALSVGIGFGLQSIFNNFVSGLILLAERPIKIGDYIRVGDQEGTVKKISVRSTEIETIHRQSVIVPNATLITDPVVNWMHLDKSCRLDLPVGVDYGTDMELLSSTLLDVARSHRGVLKHPPPVVHFSGFGDSSLDFELRVFLRDVRERITTSSALRFAILAALRDANISIPFPQRDVHMRGARRRMGWKRQISRQRSSRQALDLPASRRCYESWMAPLFESDDAPADTPFEAKRIDGHVVLQGGRQAAAPGFSRFENLVAAVGPAARQVRGVALTLGPQPEAYLLESLRRVVDDVDIKRTVLGVRADRASALRMDGHADGDLLDVAFIGPMLIGGDAHPKQQAEYGDREQRLEQPR
ncbi:mechanosensitive ion channel family protein [Methyloceanibacter stevinii]|uniref:mechanosensitive ion channel family protein n=1 Tax=Methyloceanibacter stevinii TaxID=1774970 RepID=UPI000A799CDC|nr:mechanosensitive ion channel domain-containing protein [Methyloceanibacter stevinii]